MTSGRLARELGRVLRFEREAARLTQTELADRIGLKRQQLARFEAGRHPSSTKLIEDLFAGLNLQIRVATEATDSELDRQIVRAETAGVDKAMTLLMEFHAIRCLAAAAKLPEPPRAVLDGPIAACLQGTPIVPQRIDLLVLEAEREQLDRWVEVVVASDLLVATRSISTLPESVTIECAGQDWQVRSLSELMADHPDVARVAAASEAARTARAKA